ncbi:polymorphic toxin type 47 domain-containing protein, partial [Pseudomonas gelidaquae]|uniref:polymorphic toxin type 47 domain-containing protein n=2 Tax=unclassified Pseudomonas TaxID=196821 RepID=UPI001595B278
RLHAHAVTQENHDLYRRHYDYDKTGNLTRLLDTRKGEHHYHYDPLARLTRADHSQDVQERFGHDPAGNLLMQDRPGPDIVAGNRLMIQGDHHYDYDAFGNLIRQRRGKGHQLVTEYRYDCQHRLIGITQPNGQTASYCYDPFGRRISKTVDGITTEFFWQGDKLIAEHHADRHRSYIYEPDSFRPLALLAGFGPQDTQPFHYQLDHLGTPQELTAPNGEIVWSAHYRAYGQISRLDINKIDNPLRFQGQYFDPESGLHYNRHRYYNPDIGRYLTPDPVKLAGGINAYQYAPNPTGWVDPQGLACTPHDCPQPVAGGTWRFNSDVDVDRRKEFGNAYEQMHKGLNEAFGRTGLSKEDFKVTKWGKDQYGKSFPTEWRVSDGPNKGAEVNIDNPLLVPSTNGPRSPHIGYQTAGKRGAGGAKRGHILLNITPVSRSRIGVNQ